MVWSGLQMQLREPLVWLFILFVVATTAYLHRVPGLFGDEASEGYNVYGIQQSSRVVVIGERSYIGPLVDYVRLPFVWLFGYTTVALRGVMWIASIATFWLAATVLGRLFGDQDRLYALTFLVFSPVYLLYQRLGWAISLFPFFAFLTLFFLTSRYRDREVWTGLAAGLGLHNYLVWLPTLAGIVAGWAVSHVQHPRQWRLKAWFLSGLAFWAAFGTQFAILMLEREDQGDIGAVLDEFGQRLAALPHAWQLYVSGASYIAIYTGELLSEVTMWVLTGLLAGAVLVAAAWSPQRRVVWAWLLGTVVQVLVLLVMIDRYTLRYFVAPTLVIWMLAGVGVAVLVRRIRLPETARRWLPVGLAVLLMMWMLIGVLRPFMQTGGSRASFSIGPRLNTAADIVATDELVRCIRGAGPVFSKDVHIYNRLRLWALQYSDVIVPEDTHEAHWLVNFRPVGELPGKGALCPELAHFRIDKRK